MEVSQAANSNPLGLSLDFMFGRGYLWAQRQRLSDWIALESLRMEIPDLKFPFDARTGLDRFRHTRCLVREVEFAISEVGLGDLLSEAASQLDGFQDLQVRFLEDAAHISLRVRAFGANTHISFRAALIPPEPARADEIHLSLYDYRAYGPLPYPARLLAFELMTSLLNTPTLRAPGRGHSFTVGIAGDILSFRPLKLLFLHIFPRVGWKLPNLSNITLESARIRPGVLTIRGVSHDDLMPKSRPGAGYHLAATLEGARALAAYEAKDLFAHADQALFDGQIRQALNMLASYRDIYGLHPELVSRLLGCLVADPSPSNLAEAESICRELGADDARDLQALYARPMIALANARGEEVAQAFEKLSAELRARSETADWILCELAAAAYLRAQAPEAAASRLREVLKVAPRNRVALEELGALYERLGENSGLEETLKRLTGVYTDRDTLKTTYLTLARHLMNRSGDLGEARMYLEKVLRLDPSELEALNTLGESYVLGGEPLRALKAFGSAARAAESNALERQASRLHFRVAELWFTELQDPSQALLSCRRALSLAPLEGRELADIQERARLLRFAAELCEARSRHDESVEYWTELLTLLERSRELAHGGAASPAFGTEEDAGLEMRIFDELVEANEHLARLYETRERPHAAASHWRRVLELAPSSGVALEHLEDYLRQAGRPEQLIELYNDLLRGAESAARAVALHEKLAEIYVGLGLVDDAQQAFRLALDADPIAVRPRQALIGLLRENGRFETLRDALNSLLVRMRDRDVRWELLVELGDVLERNLAQPAAAARAYVEAMQLKPSERIALEGACRVLEALVAQSGPSARAPVGTQELGKLLEHMLIRMAEIAPSAAQQREALIKLALLCEERGDAAAGAEARNRAQALVASSEGETDFVNVDSRLDAMLLGDGDDGDAIDDLPEEDDEAASPSAEHLDPAAGLETFRDKFQAMLKRPANLPERATLDPDSALGRVIGASAHPAGQQAAAQQDGAPPAVDAPMAALERARQVGNPEAIVACLKTVLDDDATDIVFFEGQRLGLERELGELLYYELEDAEAALPYLEAVHRAEPEGAGGAASVVNALESIYEEQGRLGARVKLLEARLKAAETAEMDLTYRLLLAQLVWDRGADAAAARGWLGGVIERDRQNEAAHRLLAEIASAEGDFERAATHMKTVLVVAGGGLDAVEVERELADMLLNRLGDPARARPHYESVLTAAPGDSLALEGIKQCQAAADDWAGYVASLGRELGLLTGKPGGLSLVQMTEVKADQVPSVLRVAASQIISDAAQIVEHDLGELEQARRLWGLAFELWPEHVEALERRIELDRGLQANDDLAGDLEAYSAMLLDPRARFEALIECAKLHAEVLGNVDAARPLYAEAIAMVHDEENPPDGFDEARRALKSLQPGDDR
ncbi:MAG: hypothetical protein H0U74_23865 [Bradymonadaceae bacterium]|nr:hypothetical protein [Lujinxingiaceae bacterium]